MELAFDIFSANVERKVHGLEKKYDLFENKDVTGSMPYLLEKKLYVASY